MQKQTNIKFKRRLGLVSLASLALTVLVPVAGYAWGPDRDTYTMKNPADHVTFNSITDNPVLGDERNFVRVAEAGTGIFKDEVEIVPGKEYEVYIAYHNNAASNLNLPEAGSVGMALSVRISSDFSGTVTSSKKGKASAIISSINATPNEVWDEAYFTTKSKAEVHLEYVNGSAVIHNNGELNGTVIAREFLFSDNGVYIGYNKMTGNLPGCSEYAGHIIYRVRAVQMSSKVTKKASVDGINFSDKVTAKPGDTITYKVEFENTGTMDITNVVFRDKLPQGVTLIPGTTYITDNGRPNGFKMPDTIGQNGFNSGLYGPGTKATLTYKVKVNDDVVENGNCGTNSFKNTVYVDHDGGEIEDSSTFEVVRECKDDPKTPDPDPEPDPTPDPETPPELPKTGPGEIALAIIAAICVAMGVFYWYRSQKEVSKLEKVAAGKVDNGNDKADKKAEETKAHHKKE